MTRPESMPHDEAIELLPWLVNESLSAGERQAVTAHATDCVICRRELDQLKVLQDSIRRSSEPVMAPGIDMRNINARIDAQLERESAAARLLETVHGFFRSPWRIAFAAQSIALVAIAAVFLLSQYSEPKFVTLTTPQSLPAGDYVRVVFDPTIDLTAIAAMLEDRDLSVADGPTERGVYTLRFSADVGSGDREHVVNELRGDQRVLFAEPVSGGDR